MAEQTGWRAWVMAAVAAAAFALAAALMLARPYGDTLGLTIRATAILGYEAVFLAALSSADMRLMRRLFGRPFVKVHHLLSIAGLVLMALHPVGVAIGSQDLAVFVPRFDSLRAFLRLGGRPALYLFGLGALTAALRRPAGRGWRYLHLVNYVAFALVTVHAAAIGTDFQAWPARAVPFAFAALVVIVLVRRRLSRR
jgi:sulfoxide reductase heme-binding subunit YedZ